MIAKQREKAIERTLISRAIIRAIARVLTRLGFEFINPMIRFKSQMKGTNSIETINYFLTEIKSN